MVERTAGHFSVAARQFVEQFAVGRRALLEVERRATPRHSHTLERTLDHGASSERD